MKKTMSILTALLVSMLVVVPVLAEDHPPRLVDDAWLLTSGEAQRVESELDRISEEFEFDVAVVTVNSLDGQSAQDFADDYYDYNGYGMGADCDGAMLVVCMEEREWHITTCGYGMAAMPDYEIDYIGEQFVPYLSEGDYETAFLTFASCCEEYVGYAYDEGVEYDPEDYVSAEVEEGFRIGSVMLSLGVALIIGFVLAFLPMLFMKKEMKTVELKKEARDYLMPGSRMITMSRDQFLYHTINRTPKPKNTSSGRSGGGGHISSSGRSHGGGGGRF